MNLQCRKSLIYSQVRYQLRSISPCSAQRSNHSKSQNCTGATWERGAAFTGCGLYILKGGDKKKRVVKVAGFEPASCGVVIAVFSSRIVHSGPFVPTALPLSYASISGGFPPCFSLCLCQVCLMDIAGALIGQLHKVEISRVVAVPGQLRPGFQRLNQIAVILCGCAGSEI